MKYVTRRFGDENQPCWGVFYKNDVKGLGSTVYYGQAVPLRHGNNRSDIRNHCDHLNKEVTT